MDQQIEVLVFSKDRPLQLHAYLSSLIYATGIDQADITVILPCFSGKYVIVKENFPNVKFLREMEYGGFSNTLKYFLDNTKKEYILFGCDDVIYKNKVDLNIIPEIISKNQLLGFSLRLGSNISHSKISFRVSFIHDEKANLLWFMPPEHITESVVTWAWPGQYSHWGYPFELMSSVYPKHLICQIFNEKPESIKSPNHLESNGAIWCHGQISYYKPLLGMFNGNSKAVAQDVNRVQDAFPNKFTGTEEQDPELLKRLYAEGKRINWKKLWGTVDSDCFVGDKYWEVV